MPETECAMDGGEGKPRRRKREHTIRSLISRKKKKKEKKGKKKSHCRANENECFLHSAYFSHSVWGDGNGSSTKD